MSRQRKCLTLAATVLLALLLAGCVPLPVAQPARSPLAIPTQRVWLPVYYISGAPVVGVSQDVRYRSCDTLARLGVQWHYDWSLAPLDCPGSEGVPMVWSARHPVSALPPSRYVLLFNECDLADQCNTDPIDAAIAWRAWELAYPERLFIGPAVSDKGLPWLRAWREAYVKLYGTPPRIDALAVHCYAGVPFCQNWITQNITLAQTWTQSKTVWVTEWAISVYNYAYLGLDYNTATAWALRDAEVMRAWLAQQPGVARQAWFLAQSAPQVWRTALYDDHGEITVYGTWFVATARGR